MTEKSLRNGGQILVEALLRTGKPLEASKDYAVAGWASVNEGTEGPPIWDVVTRYVSGAKTLAPRTGDHVRVLGA